VPDSGWSGAPTTSTHGTSKGKPPDGLVPGPDGLLSKVDSMKMAIIPTASRTGQSGVPQGAAVSPPTAIFELGPVYTLPNQPFEGLGAQATYEGRLYIFLSAQTPKFLIESLGD
jgi:hypothetical protein